MKVDKDWKIKIDNLGKDHFERIEMLRLGFWKPEKNIDTAKEQKVLEELYQKVSNHKKDVNLINKELESFVKQDLPIVILLSILIIISSFTWIAEFKKRVIKGKKIF